ncbi:AzlD domain-containing protein [Archaeoglobus sp.]
MIEIIFVVAVGTYLTRLIPLLLKDRLNLEKWSEWLSYSSTALISALFVTTFVSFPINPRDLTIGLISLAVVYASYVKSKNLGISIIVGVLAYYILSISIG